MRAEPLPGRRLHSNLPRGDTQAMGLHDKHRTMIELDITKDFLDACGVEHEDGVVEDLPDSIADDKLAAGVASVLEKHPKENVLVYLHAFNTMNECAWKNLDELLQTDDRLQF